MTVSVIIPTYNHAQYVLAALESAFAQTLQPVEIIVVNDGSPDDTAERLRPLVEAGRIRYIEQPNAGQGAARNRGLAEAGGKYIAFLDDDDRWPPDKLRWQVDALEQAPNAAMVYGPHELLSADGAQTSDDPNQSAHEPADDAYSAFRRRNWILSVGQTLIRGDALRAIGGFDSAIWGSDDWDLYIRLARQGSFLFEPKVALHYRRHDSNASSSALRHAVNHLKVVRRHIGLLNVPLLVRHQREASRYFLSRLMTHASAARCDGRYREALKAQGIALTFRPSLIFKRRWMAPFVANVLSIAPRAPAGGRHEP